VTTLSERLMRIDPGTMRVTAVQVLSTQAFAPVFAGGALWVILATPPHGQIQQIDPSSVATATALTDVRDPTALGAAAGGVWAADANGNLTWIDASGKASAPLHIGPSLSAVGAGAGAVWAAVTA
jgi:hypothetical protein